MLSRSILAAVGGVGAARLNETVPPQARGISEYVSCLDDQELAVLESALDKVAVDCTFG